MVFYLNVTKSIVDHLIIIISQQTVMSQMEDDKWAALLENSLTRKEEQKVYITAS